MDEARARTEQEPAAVVAAHQLCPAPGALRTPCGPTGPNRAHERAIGAVAMPGGSPAARHAELGTT